MSAREVIIDRLRRVSRRILLNQVLRYFAYGLCLILVPGLALRLSWSLAGWEIPAGGAVMGLWTVVLACLAFWRLTRRGRALSKAAGVADCRGCLKDELKTAFSFIRAGVSSPWIDHQIQRAATTAAGLDPRQIVPTALPKGVLLADGLMVFLAVFLWYSPFPAPRELETSSTFSEAEEQAQSLRDLLQAPRAGEAVNGKPEEDGPRLEALQRLEMTLQHLETGNITLEEGLQELQEAENILTEGSLDRGALREGLEELADTLGDPLQEVAEAMGEQNLDEAGELLRALAEKLLEEGSTETAEELADRLKWTKIPTPELQDWLDDLKKAAEAILTEDEEEARRALEDAARALESMAREMDEQERLNEAAMRLEQLQVSLAQDEDLQELSGEAMRVRTPMPHPSEEEAGSELEESSDREPGTYPAGGPENPTDEAEQAEPTSLKVQLEREILEASENPNEPEEIFFRQSKEQQSMLDYENISGSASYTEAEAVSPDQIPWRYRRLVKNYFLAIREDRQP